MTPCAKFDWAKVDRPELVMQRFPSRRSVVYSAKGIVASSQPLATEAGLEILRLGGNAADAAVAVAAALNVTEPSSCGIGGDAFCLFYNARLQTVEALNGSGHSPQKLSIDVARRSGATGSQIPFTNINSITVPGTAAAWVDTVDIFGSGHVSLAEILDPAIRLAEEGVPVSEIHSYFYQQAEDLLLTAPNGREMLLHGRAPLPGQILRLPNLASTFRSVAEHGKDGFYKGRVAQAIVDLIQSEGGVMELEDLANHRSTVVQPIKYTYGGDVTIYECPPNGQGITALMALGILERIQEQGSIKPLLEMEHNSTEYLHTLIEALRLAFADSQHFVTDPEVEYVPVQELLNKEYLSSRARLFDPARSNPNVAHGNPTHSSDTVYFSVADQWGNACSFIQSNYAGGFGTGAVPKGYGFTLQNRGSGFVLIEGHPNALKGGKRPYHTIIPSIATRGDELFLSFGVMGGFMQPQGHVQVLLNVLRGFSVQAALDAPRFCISPGMPDANTGTGNGSAGIAGDVNSEVYFEEGISDETVTQLRSPGALMRLLAFPRFDLEMGHDTRRVSGFARSMMGRGQIIQRIVDECGKTVWAAGSDPRGDGHAAPQI